MVRPMAKKTFETTLVREGSMCFIPVPFDPKPVFGKIRAPVRVSICGHVYRSTIASMGNGPCLPLRKSNREAAGLEGGETVRVTLELDEAPREVVVPTELARALRAARARGAWDALSHSHKREHVEAIEQAKRPETRARRVEAAVAMVLARPAETGAPERAKKATARPAETGAPRAAKKARVRAKEAAPATDDARPRLNAEWHRAHRMPKNPTEDQRLEWHEAHAAVCACRPMPEALAAKVAARAKKKSR